MCMCFDDSKRLARAVFGNIGPAAAAQFADSHPVKGYYQALNAFAVQRDLLLSAATTITGRRYAKPFKALRDVVALHGFKIRAKELPVDVWAEMDFAASVIWTNGAHTDPSGAPFTTDSAQRLRFRMAREFGRLRLDPARTGRELFGMPTEEYLDLFASVFLVPREEFMHERSLTSMLTEPSSQPTNSDGISVNFLFLTEKYGIHPLLLGQLIMESMGQKFEGWKL